MSENSKIEWTDSSWNPVTGCHKISPGCKFCYAERFAERFRGTPNHPFEFGFDVRLWEKRLSIPYQWKQPRLIFVNSMSDLFLDEIPDLFIKKVFSTMLEANHHVYQLLTKRPERLLDWCSKFIKENEWGLKRIPEHIWLGVSVESKLFKKRIDVLKKVPAKIRFLSVEPLLENIKLNQSNLRGIHWVIAGGESGPKARPMKLEWVLDIKNACQKTNTRFFFKQWGEYNKNGVKTGKKHSGRALDGKEYNEIPLIENEKYSQMRR